MKTTGIMKSAMAALLALTLTACGTDTSAGEPAETAAAASTEEKTVYKVAIVKQLDHASLDVLGDLGVSNRVVSPPAVIECHSGVLAVFVLAKGGE